MRKRRSVFASVALFCLTAAAAGDVVINEIMYNPPSGNRDEVYIELYNTSPTAVDLTGWQFTRGITFTFPSIVLQPNDYLVVCRNEALVQQLYGTTKTVGNFTGYLARGGETLELFDPATSTVIDRVSYGDREPWPVRADGNGAALGLINPALDNDVGDHWAAEMVVNNGWRKIVTRGVFDPVGNIKIFLELSGEALIDDVELIRESQPGVNLLSNGGFESGTAGWVFNGNHGSSTVEAGDAHSGTYALHIRATGQGTFSTDNIEHPISISATSREFFTLSLWAKPLDNINAITLGSGDGRHDTLYQTFQLSLWEPELIPGSPGRQNLVYRPLPQPLFIRHDRAPNYPDPGQPATVTVTVENPAYVQDIRLYYAVQSLPLGSAAPDPESLSFAAISMATSGPSSFTAVIAGQPGGRLVRYYVEMTSTNAATFRRPRQNDLRRYYGYYVRSASVPAHKVPVFYIQVNPRCKSLIDELADDLGAGMFKGYNLNVRCDFIDLKSGEYFGDVRTRYRGGVGTRRRKNNIKIFFNDGHRWEGLRVLNVTPNNQGRATVTLGLANALCHHLERLFGIPSLEMAQWARVYYNGSDRGLLTMVEQPNRNFLERFGLSRDGQMFKSIGWRLAWPRIRGDEGLFYGRINDGQDSARKLRDSIDNPYTLDEYMNYAYDQELDNERGYQDLLAFIQTINDIPNSYPMPTANPDYIWLTDCVGTQTMLVQMKNYLESTCNVDMILRKFVIDAVGGDTDRVIHNHYWYMGEDGKWIMFSWDRDFWSRTYDDGYAIFMQSGRWYKPGTAYPRTFRLPFNIHTGSWPTLTVMLWVPEFRQLYYQLIREAYEEVVTPFTMKNYIDKQLAYVMPEHSLAGSPALNLSEFQAQQDWLNAQRVRIFQYLQSSVFDMDPGLLNPLVCDVRHTPPVPAPGQAIEFQANAISSVATGLCTTVTLMLRGPGESDFTAHKMTRIADDPSYTGSVPDPAHTYYYTASGLNAGEVYEYFVVAEDVWGNVRATTVPKQGAAAPRRVMADDNPALSAQGIVINEIMYNSDLDANEYIELTNRSSRIVDLSGWFLIDTSGKRPFVFENDTTLAPGEYIVVAYNAWRVRQIYGIENVVGDYAFRLANGGDTIYLYDKNATPIDMVQYLDEPPWPTAPDGRGPSLELIDPSLDNNDPNSYVATFPAGHRGTPGRRNLVPGSAVEEWKQY